MSEASRIGSTPKQPTDRPDALDEANEWLISQLGPHFRGELELYKTLGHDVLRLRGSLADLRDREAAALAACPPRQRDHRRHVITAIDTWMDRTKHLHGPVAGDPAKASCMDVLAPLRKRIEAVKHDRRKVQAIMVEVITEYEAKAAVTTDPAERAFLLKGLEQLRAIVGV